MESGKRVAAVVLGLAAVGVGGVPSDAGRVVSRNGVSRFRLTQPEGRRR